MAQNLTNFDNLLKEIYSDKIYDQIAYHNMFLTELEKNQGIASVDGKSKTLFLHSGQNVSTSSIAESATLPTAGNQSYDQAIVPIKWTFSRGQLTDQVIEATASNKAAAAQALAAEMQGVKKDCAEQLNRQFWGDGSGNLAVVKGAVSADATVILDGQISGETATGHLKVGQEIEFWKSADGAQEEAAKTITVASITDHETFEASEAITLTDNDFMSLAGARGAGLPAASTKNEMMGLGTIINNAATSSYDVLQGVDRSTNAWWDAQVVAGSAVITEALMQEAFDAAVKNGADVGNMLILLPWDLHRKLGSLLAGDRRYNVEGKSGVKYEGGWMGVTFNGVPVIPDRDAVNTNVYFMDKNTISIEELTPMSFMDKDGAVLSRVANSAAYEFVLRYYANMAVNSCKSNAVLTAVTAS